MSEENKSSESPDRQSMTTEQRDDLEVANDFNDLNLEIVSEKPAASIPEEPDEDATPSIDDFVIAREDHTTPQQNEDQWYAEVLGQEMGPFPFEELVHLVACEEVGPEDRIRHSAQGEWMTAGEIAGLFPEMETDFELGGGAEFHAPDQQGGNVAATGDPSDLQVVGGELNHILSDARPQHPVSDNVSPIVPEKGTPQNMETASDETTGKDAAGEEPQEDPETKRKREVAERLNAWLGEQVKEPVVESRREEKEDAQPAVTPSVSAASGTSATSASTATYKPPVKPGPPPKVKKTKQAREKMDLGGLKNLLDARVLGAIGVVVVLGVLYYFVPSLFTRTNDKKIYERYQEIYAQIQRARKDNPGRLTTLAKEVVPELKETVDKLERAGAGAKKPLKQKLFFGGKYCLIPMLEKKMKEPSPLDEKFKKYQKEVKGLLDK